MQKNNGWSGPLFDDMDADGRLTRHCDADFVLLLRMGVRTRALHDQRERGDR
jgi:hypothetical protein